MLAIDAEQPGSFGLISRRAFQRTRDHASFKDTHGLLERHSHKLRQIALAVEIGFTEWWQILGNYQGAARVQPRVRLRS